jgi:hypothetical protein
MAAIAEERESITPLRYRINYAPVWGVVVRGAEKLGGDTLENVRLSTAPLKNSPGFAAHSPEFCEREDRRLKPTLQAEARATVVLHQHR